jgi:hypothetical protein
MSLTGSLISLLLGAILFGFITRVAIPPAPWLSLILLSLLFRDSPVSDSQ